LTVLAPDGLIVPLEPAVAVIVKVLMAKTETDRMVRRYIEKRVARRLRYLVHPIDNHAVDMVPRPGVTVNRALSPELTLTLPEGDIVPCVPAVAVYRERFAKERCAHRVVGGDVRQGE